jgi:predicted RNA-binding Zn ribbon-like protein
MVDDEQVPPPVRLIRDFVNTYEPQVDKEFLPTSDALRDWLAEQHLVPAGAPVADSDLTTALVVREGFRNVLLGHAGHDPDPAAMDALRAALAELPMRLDFDTSSYRLISIRTDAFGQALGQLLDAVRQTTQDGTWLRLKVCARDTCRWAFFDASRNQVRRWCSMAGCGNFVKMRRASVTRKARAGATTATEVGRP